MSSFMAIGSSSQKAGPMALRRSGLSSHSVAVGTRYDNFMALLDEHARLCQY